MLKIRLCCVTGMLSTLILNKIADAARLRQIEIDIQSIPENYVETALKKEAIDIVLLGPHMSYKFEKIKSICDSHNVASGVISMRDYGFMNGDNILNSALSLIDDMKNAYEKKISNNNENDIENSNSTLPLADEELSSNSPEDNILSKTTINEDLTSSETKNTDSNVSTNSNKPEISFNINTIKNETCLSYNALSDTTYNLKGDNNMINKIKDLLFNAEKEIYMNTNMDISQFQEEFTEASQKGVRITVVACDKYKDLDLQIDKLYAYSNEKNRTSKPKLMMVIDNTTALVAEKNSTTDELDYTITDNPLLVATISKNIDNYIYVLKLRDNIDFKLRDN